MRGQSRYYHRREDPQDPPASRLLSEIVDFKCRAARFGRWRLSRLVGWPAPQLGECATSPEMIRGKRASLFQIDDRASCSLLLQRRLAKAEENLDIFGTGLARPLEHLRGFKITLKFDEKQPRATGRYAVQRIEFERFAKKFERSATSAFAMQVTGRGHKLIGFDR